MISLPDSAFTAEPTSMQVLQARKYIQERLKRSLWRIAERSVRVIDADPQIQQNVSHLDTDRRLSPHLHLANLELVKAAKAGHADEVHSWLAKLGYFLKAKTYCDNFEVTTPGDDYHHNFMTAELLRMKLRNIRGESTLIGASNPDRLDDARCAVADALNILRCAHLQINNQIKTLICELSVFQGRVVSGATDVRVFGLVFLREPSPHQVADLYYCEHLVHEAAHLYLDALFCHDAFVLNSSEERYEAPIRRDARPLTGIFHATYVLSRMVQAFRSILNLDGPKTYQAASMLDLFELQLASGAKTLKKHAQLTPNGQKILSDIVGLLDGRYKKFVT